MQLIIPKSPFLATIGLAIFAVLLAGCPNGSSQPTNGQAPRGPVAGNPEGTAANDGSADATAGADATPSDDGGAIPSNDLPGTQPPPDDEPAPRTAIVNDDSIEFDEPAGITYAGGLLFIADTNNHEIRTIDLHDNFRTGTFVIDGLQPPSMPPEPRTEVAIAQRAEDPRTARAQPPQPSTDENDDPRTATPRPPTPPGDEDVDVLDSAFPFRARFSWAEIEAELPQDPQLWMNTDKPLKISDFEGKFVMLDFWTYCCINCIHILPELKKLERAYPNQLVVIGVHSAKFETEKETNNVKEAVLRYEIEHPVVNDIGSTLWQHLGVNSWPTVMLIDPEGHLVFVRKAEWTFEELDHVFRAALPYYRDKGVLDEKPVKFPLLRDKEKPKTLNFPGKVLADGPSQRLFVADSNNNRIVISSLDGRLLDVIGTGAIGQDDGAYDEATFNKPQGMALQDQTLYVADTENHLIRKIDLENKHVATIAGTGVQGRSAWPGLDQFHRFGAPPERYVADPKEFAINSPWALQVHYDDLYIAMAGPHQIWKMTLDEEEIGPYAGNGREDIVDGQLLPNVPYEEYVEGPERMRENEGSLKYSAFAQPSGLSSDGDWLYVADSEGSSIRAVPFAENKDVKTIVGSSQLPFNRLFIFANRDGEGLLRPTVPQFEWRGRVEQTAGPALQHCLGVVHHDGKLYVADTYNNSIKMIDLDGNVCTTIAGERPRTEEKPEIRNAKPETNPNIE